MPALGTQTAAVATAFPDATRIAAEILAVGGNAADAAVAAAWALAVCEPAGSGLGGQAVLMLRSAWGDVRVIDGHSHAPAAAEPGRIRRRQQRYGHCATTIPSLPATLDYAQRRYGMLPPAAVMQPAIRLAEEGYKITRLQHRQAGWVADDLRKSPSTAALFLVDGLPPPASFRLRQPQLAATLRRLARVGVEDFYRGEMAREIARDMEDNGGLITEQDLAGCALPVEREPLVLEHHGYRVLSVPPPGGGLQVLLGLRLMEQFAAAGFDWYTALALAIYAAFHERDLRPLLPDELTPELLSSERVARIVARTLATRIAQETKYAEEPGETTHLTVTDAAGNVVGLTQSIQSLYGAKVAHPRLGFLYNNYLRTCPRWSHPHAIGPRSIPRSNAAPTLVLDAADNPVLALGAAGSRRITASILHVLSGVIDRGLDVASAVSVPRLHALLSGSVWIERPALSPKLAASLGEFFPRIECLRRNDYRMGCVQAIQWAPDGSVFAAADPRRDGSGCRVVWGGGQL